MVVDEGILRTFKADLGHHLHADDLEPLGIPGEHRNVIGSQIAKWVNRGYMVECGRRKSAVPSRNGAKSNEYRLTKDGVRHVTVGERGDNSSGASLSGEDGAGGRGQTVGRDARSCARSADAAHDDDSPEDLFGAECPAMASTSAYSPDNEYA